MERHDPGPQTIGALQALNLELQCLQNPHLDGIAAAVVVRPEELHLVASQVVSADVTAEVQKRLVEAVQEANSAFLHLDIRYLQPYDTRGVLELRDGDLIPIASGADSTRKIVVVLPVAFDGHVETEPGEPGETPLVELTFPAAGKTVPLLLGEARMFPAHMQPTVLAPSGVQVTTHVVYAHGPAFR